MPTTVTYCPNHPERRAGSRSGLCRTCYWKKWNQSADGPRCSRHPERRVKAHGMCDSCYQQQWKLKTYGTAGDPRNAERARAGHQRRKATDPDYIRRNHYRYKYKLTLEQVEQLIADQQGKCAICKETPVRLHLDHDAETGIVRGMLCGSCNRALGLFRHNIVRLESATEYLAL